MGGRHAVQVPSVGRIVHFVGFEKCYASIITKVIEDNRVNLYLFPSDETDTGATLKTNVEFDAEGKVDNSWHWPEMV